MDLDCGCAGVCCGICVLATAAGRPRITRDNSEPREEQFGSGDVDYDTEYFSDKHLDLENQSVPLTSNKLDVSHNDGSFERQGARRVEQHMSDTPSTT